MAKFSASDRTLRLKLVYYGPARSGKSTNLQRLHDAMFPRGSAPLPRFDLAGDEAIVFESLPLLLNLEPPASLQLQFAAIPGDVKDATNCRVLLQDADGVVFVADARKERLRENLMSWADLLEHFRCLNIPLSNVPVVMQYNQCDRAAGFQLSDLDRTINSESYPSFQATASQALGVDQCFHEIVRRAAARAFQDLHLEQQSIPRGAFASAIDVALLQTLGSSSNEKPPQRVDRKPRSEPKPAPHRPKERSSNARASRHASAPVAGPRGPVVQPVQNAPDSSTVDSVLKVIGTRRKELESENQSLHRTMDDFRQQSREILQSLTSQLESLSQEIQHATPSVRAKLQQVRKSLERLCTLHDEKLGRAGSKVAAKATHQRCNLTEILDTAVRHLRPMLISRGIDVKSGSLPAVEGDRAALGHLFLTLITEMVEMSPSKRSGTLSLSISSRMTTKGLLIGLQERVEARRGASDADSGAKHRRAVPTRKMLLAKQIVELHQGRIGLRSSPEGRILIRVLLPHQRVLSEERRTRKLPVATS